MKKVYAVLALVLVAAVPASAASAAPAEHFEESVVGDVFVCASAQYTVIEGTLKSVFHEGSSRSGNTNFTGTLVPQHVVLEDQDENQYLLAGAVWFGDTANAQHGSAQGTFTAYLNIVSPGGGVVDTVRQTGHFSTSGNEFFLDHGTCELPE
jgi:opacity protein-like surface antigen